MKYTFSHRLSQADKNGFKAVLADLKNLLHFAIQLTPSERGDIASVADKRTPFVLKAHSYVKNDPSKYGSDLDAQDFFDDVDTWDFMSDFIREMKVMFEEMDDTALLAGAEAYAQANYFYLTAQVKAANGIPGYDAIVEELGKLYPGRGPAKNKASGDNPQESVDPKTGAGTGDADE